jgi:hypothetical protein
VFFAPRFPSREDFRDGNTPPRTGLASFPDERRDRTDEALEGSEVLVSGGRLAKSPTGPETVEAVEGPVQDSREFRN